MAKEGVNRGFTIATKTLEMVVKFWPCSRRSDASNRKRNVSLDMNLTKRSVKVSVSCSNLRTNVSLILVLLFALLCFGSITCSGFGFVSRCLEEDFVFLVCQFPLRSVALANHEIGNLLSKESLTKLPRSLEIIFV
uniref:Transmembrane protein n=1 Tax=Glossina pallidipes TaxID=7398 RepID=A0A1A9ZK13_GLOPL